MFQKTILKQLNFVISINNKMHQRAGCFFKKLEKQALNAQLMKLFFILPYLTDVPENKGSTMNIKKTVVASLLACMLPAVVMAKDISVGVSMALFDDNFLTILRTAMQKEMQKDGVKAQVEDAKGDVSQQLQQVQNFIGQGVDAIIVNPVDTNAVKPIMDQATKAGIPLIFVNRRPQAQLTDKMAYVGSDSVLAGRLQMEALAKAMNGKGNVDSARRPGE
jgi:inositol transport system substrate-binding protein